MKKMLRNIMMSLVVVSSCNNADTNKNISSEHLHKEINPEINPLKSQALDFRDWTDVFKADSNMINRMAYADTNNFLHIKIYPCGKCYLRNEVAKDLLKAGRMASDMGYKLVIFDCYRPSHIQKIMYDLVQDERYVANPAKGSNHNRGCAIDLTLSNKNGTLLDMGTEFDDFSKRAHLNAGDLNGNIIRNRATLSKIMIDCGFVPYAYEWWHFNHKNSGFSLSNQAFNCD